MCPLPLSKKAMGRDSIPCVCDSHTRYYPDSKSVQAGDDRGKAGKPVFTERAIGGRERGPVLGKLNMPKQLGGFLEVMTFPSQQEGRDSISQAKSVHTGRRERATGKHRGEDAAASGDAEMDSWPTLKSTVPKLPCA